MKNSQIINTNSKNFSILNNIFYQSKGFIMKTKRLAINLVHIYAMLLMMLIAGNELLAQNIINGQSCPADAQINNTSTGKIVIKGNLTNYGTSNAATPAIKNAGTIEFTGVASVFANETATPISDGKIDNSGTGIIKFSGNVTVSVFTGTGTPIGVSATERIAGTVEYGAASDAQNVWGIGNSAPTFYTNLTLSGASTKAIADAAHVSEVYTASTSGNRAYTGTFYYDGSLAQTIFGENGGSAGSNRYNNLDFSGGGTKSIISGAPNIVYVDGGLTTYNGTATLVNNLFYIGQNAATASNIAGAVTIDGTTPTAEFKNGMSNATFGSTVDLNSGGLFTMDNSGFVTFNGITTVNSGKIFNNGSANTADLTIGGSGSLILATGGSALFELAASREMYITGTYTNNDAARNNQTFGACSEVHYNGPGAQTIVSTVASNPYGSLATYNADKSVNGNVFFACNLSVAGGNINMGTDIMHMTDVTKSVVYNNPGNFVASQDGASEVVGKFQLDGGAAFVLANPYRLNNHRDLITFTAGSFAAGDNFQFESHPGTAPVQYDVNTDVNRKVIPSWSIGSGEWTFTLEAGYMASEFTGSPGLGEDKLKFFRTKGSDPTSDIEKIATGSTYTRTVGGAIPHSLAYAGIISSASNNVDGNPDANFTSGNELLLRASNQTVTIANGRWSNPATWDDGVEPPSDAQAFVRHTVHVGYVRAVDNYLVDEATPNAMAARVQIGATGAVYNNVSSLLIGTGDPGTAYSLSAGANLINYGRTGTVPADLTGNIDASGSTQYSGFYVVQQVTGYTIPGLFNNCGLVGNAGTINIGN
jgi:hypothetical protein